MQMHSTHNSDGYGDKRSYFFVCFYVAKLSALICQLWHGAHVIREYYLAISLPLFHWTSTYLLSLSDIFLEIL